MLHIFPKRGDRTSGGTAGRTRGQRRRRPGFEGLEGRQLMSLGSEFLVNTTTVRDQLKADSATAANGLSIVVWVDEFSKTDRDIKAQMYNADGTKRGPQIDVDSTLQDSVEPTVAVDAQGNFVIAWTHNTNGARDIMARRFNSSGQALGGRFAVANSAKGEVDPDVAMDAKGNFVVSYTRFFNGVDPDILARRFDSSGNLVQSITVANSGITSETNSSVAMNASGQFIVAWQHLLHSVSDSNIFVTRFTASGGFQGNQAIAISDAHEQHPGAALDDAGNAVVAYERIGGSSFDVKARRMNGSGVVGPEINIRSTAAQEVNPTVALSRNGGGSFVVAYENDLIGIPGNRTVEVAEVTPSNAVVSLFNLPAFPNNESAALSIDAQGNYLLTYTGGVRGADKNIFARRGRLF